LLEAARRQATYPMGLPLGAVAEGMAASANQVDSDAKPKGNGLVPRHGQGLD
jgi:hypothetical protein